MDGDSTAARAEITLYSCKNPARTVPMERLRDTPLSETDLLWVDLVAPDASTLDAVLEALQFPPATAALLHGEHGTEFRDFGSAFGVRVDTLALSGGLDVQRRGLGIAGRPNVVVTVSPEALALIAQQRERQRDNSSIGVLGAESFTAALLDAQLETFHQAVSKLEAKIEALEARILASHDYDCLDELRHLRRAASQLRRALAAHRRVFSGLARPDFRPDQGDRVDALFLALDARYERAMDQVENLRDQVIGSFELFTTRAAMSTNRTMQALTFVTVLIGGLAVLASVLGMNFQAPFFASGSTGFWITIASMGAICGAAMLLAWRKRWL